MVHSRANKIALFIDGANFQATARALGFAIDYKRLLREFQSHGTLVRAFYYIAIAEDQEYSPLRPLIDWLGYNAYRVVTKATKAAPTSRATPRITPQVVSRHESGRPAGFGHKNFHGESFFSPGSAEPKFERRYRDLLDHARKSGVLGGGGGSYGTNHRLSIGLNNAPRSTRMAYKGDGLFKEVRLNRGRAMPMASQNS